MTWEAFYATCFVTGLLLSLISFLSGAAHLHAGHLHFHGHFGHGGGHAGGHGGNGRGGAVFNVGTITAFIAWFGGTGYLLTRYTSIWTLLAFGLATIAGLAGAFLVFWFVFKVLLLSDRDLNPADYEMIGVYGKISGTIREGGTGEIIFSQEGTRRSAPARSETGLPIPKGTEIIVTEYKRGIAYVRPFDDIGHLDSATSAGGELTT